MPVHVLINYEAPFFFRINKCYKLVRPSGTMEPMCLKISNFSLCHLENYIAIIANPLAPRYARHNLD
jgi:hypothetical protein